MAGMSDFLYFRICILLHRLPLVAVTLIQPMQAVLPSQFLGMIVLSGCQWARQQGIFIGPVTGITRLLHKFAVL
jgi:hypothetical protein